MKVTPKLNLKWIDRRATEIVKQLQNKDFETYLVGGCVRDLLLGIEPKDFDIATTARPRQVKKLISNAFIIGKRFRLVLAKSGDEQYEVTTFRRNPTAVEQNDPEISDDNLFGSAKDDAFRRDFTINALFYDPISNNIIDFVDGMKDLKNREIKMIGDPELRLPEDPIRILRAVRFAHKTNCELEYQVKVCSSQFAHTLLGTPVQRRREEILKILRLPQPLSAFFQLYDLGIMKYLAPGLLPLFENPECTSLAFRLFQKYDQHKRKSCEPYELFSLLILALALPLAGVKKSNMWLNKDGPMQTLKNELGMFNTEISAILQGLKFLPEILNFETYNTFRDKQKADFVHKKRFSEALNFAVLCDLLSDYDVHLWAEEHFKYPSPKPEPNLSPNKRLKKKKKTKT